MNAIAPKKKGLEFKIKYLIAILSHIFTATIFCGCISTYGQDKEINSMINKLSIPENTLLAITNGSSLDSVRNTLGIAARHEFTLSDKKSNYTLISCFVSVGDGIDVWLLFQDKLLINKLVPTRPKPADIGEMPKLVRKTINDPAATESQMLNYLKPYDGKGKDSTSISATILTAGAMAFSGGLSKMQQNTKQLENDYKTNETFLQLYDGCRVGLGMSINEVDALYGKPLQAFSMKNGQAARIYGSNQDLENIEPWLLFSCVAVVFNTNGNVVAVYSGDFFSDEWKK